MENKTEKERVALEAVERIAGPIFEQAAQEAAKNHMAVSRSGSYIKKAKKWEKGYSLYCPHNFRLYVDIKPVKDYLNPAPILGSLYTLRNHKTEICIQPLNECWVLVKRRQVEVKALKNRWYVIDQGSIADLQKQFRDIYSALVGQCMEALKLYLELYGGHSNFRVLNWHSEDKIKHENSVDLLPIKQKWHTEVVKKVYNEKNVEFSSPIFAANYFRNRAIEDIAPEICNALELSSPLKALKARVSCIQDILDNARLVKILTYKQKQQFQQWLFETMGVST